VFLPHPGRTGEGKRDRALAGSRVGLGLRASRPAPVDGAQRVKIGFVSLRACIMATQASGNSILLLKKLAGLILLICGVVLAALAYEDGSTGRAILGVLLAAAGIMLMVLKIVRRNTSDPL
jgi:hypothetical protein